ncbi:MAG: hypothetical protein U0905_01880 [Pirellulales bacterium]
MMDVIQQNPIVVGIVGLLIALGSLWGWVQTGQKPAFYGACGIALLTILLVAWGFLVETESEKIEAMIYATASELESNNHAAIFARIHPSATETVNRAKTELPRYKFTMAKVTRIRAIEVDSQHVPPEAKVEMNVVAEGSFEGFSGKVPRYVELTLVKSDGKWLVYDYAHREPLEGFR